MSRITRLLSLSLALLALLPCLFVGVGAEPTDLAPTAPPDPSAESAILIEVSSGDVTFAKNADTRLPMASTTKIMTAHTALSLSSPDTVISIDERAVGVEGSSVYLVAGERLTLEQLLYALMLESANDAAAAIAIGLCGSIEAFAEQMNRRASELGLTDTHFVNPHGLDDEAHYTTARELAMLTREAMQNPLFREIVSTRKTTIPHADGEGERLLVNHNKLLRLDETCVGVKTGFTKRSGRCLVSAAERNGVELIAVTLNAPNDWDDHGELLEWGFTRYRSVELCRENTCFYTLPVEDGSGEHPIGLICRETLTVTLPAESTAISCAVEAQRLVCAPVKNGEILGYARFFCDTDGDGKAEQIATAALYADSAVEKAPKPTLWARICNWWRSLFA